ncbi:arabinan endo-1,5-alpha-L-arabinosidase [Sphingomonas sp. M1-B02]|uniref:arabinan endo-1,5-alpha-L-arabinosidase n=1 Tax=Sphingomonas sp. M1-B02 TaxID=3114300 RepID=UPI002240BA71|nr:arabinan endo-1,5-alpha-L-arabinosidase [Sphingomonas sp. S6-11]UZK67665.1 arabinan endo-1,5-alpha-L-arabinosidase [Sphingomonas sp. S6-11]
MSGSLTSLSRRGLLSIGVAGAGAALARPVLGEPATLNAQLSGYLDGLHDPVMIRDGDIYHVFGSGGWTGKAGLSWRISNDLHSWRDNGSPFDSVPDWAAKAIPDARAIWAPDIQFVDGLFRLYYSVSTAGSMRSVTGFATSPTLDRGSARYGWTDHGLVVESFAGGTYNVIDANFVVDFAGDHWLAFGSYWSGLKLVALDKKSGKPKAGAPIHPIAYRPPAAPGGDEPVEGAFLFPRDGYYYLFVSYDYCCRKEKSNYYVAVGRARSITGPYLSKEGEPILDGHGTVVLAETPWGSTNWRGPGHCGLYRDRTRDLIVYHAYDVANAARPTLRLAELAWDKEGWPIALA